MEVNMTRNDKELIAVVEGRLDTITSPELEDKLMPVLAETEKLVFDFEKLEYVSSAGLRVLMATFKVMKGKGGSMVIRNVTPKVKEVFMVTGLINGFDFE